MHIYTVYGCMDDWMGASFIVTHQPFLFHPRKHLLIAQYIVPLPSHPLSDRHDRPISDLWIGTLCLRAQQLITNYRYILRYLHTIMNPPWGSIRLVI